MIEAHNLTKLYNGSGLASWGRKRNETLAVKQLNLRIEEGRILGLLGVNGAGKTTVVKMLCTLLEPTSGMATIGGFDVVRNATQVRKIVNMIAGGERSLYWRLTGRENLSYFADLYNVDGRVKKKRIEALLDLVGLGDNADKRVEQYSKGMKQRLQIARGLVNDPQYLFMDEPTIGLDVPIAREIRRLIKDTLNKTILFTTHYMEEAEELCDELAIIHKGEIVEQGTTEELKSKYKKGHSLIATVKDKGDVVNRVIHAFGQSHAATVSIKTVEEGHQIRVDTAQNVTSELVDTLTESGLRIVELRSIEPRLEDVLIAVCGEEGKE